MKTVLRSLLVVMACWLTAVVGFSAVAVVVRIDIDPKGKIEVQGKTTSLNALKAVVESSVQDKENTVVEIKAPDNIEKQTLDQVMNACRQAGVSKFSVIKQPAPKS